jgi:Bacteriocin-protection, YdeI or OmpD-Associated
METGGTKGDDLPSRARRGRAAILEAQQPAVVAELEGAPARFAERRDVLVAARWQQPPVEESQIVDRDREGIVPGALGCPHRFPATVTVELEMEDHADISSCRCYADPGTVVRRPEPEYPGGMAGAVKTQRVPGGVVHKLPRDLRAALLADGTALAAWKDITPLARNEFICWVEDAKREATRERRIRRTQEELEEGMRRPCCWPGCAHRERTGS